MEIRTEEILEDAHELTLERAYAEAAWDWSEVPLEHALYPDGEDGSGFDEHARAAVENASPYGLVGRLQDAAPVQSRQFRTLSDTLDLLRAADRLASWVAAKQAALTAEVFHHVEDHEVSRSVKADPRFTFTLAAQEIAPLLRIPGRTAHRMLGEALRLTEELPSTQKALEDGRISPAQAQVIVEESGSIPVEAVAGFEETVLETAGALTRPKLARRCRRLREELHPESITLRKARAMKDRDVTVQPEQDGMAWLGAYLPAEQAHGIFNRVDAAARSLQSPEEPRTLSQLRADVFADVLTHTCAGDPQKGTGYRGIGASVFVTVPVMTLLGHRKTDRADTPQGSSAPTPSRTAATLNPNDCAGDISVANDAARTCDVPQIAAGATSPHSISSNVPDLTGCANGLLDGYGPIDPETARTLAAHAPSFTRILVHPETGAVLSVGRDRYRPPKHLQDWVRITNPTCVHPGCNRSSMSCEIDHVTPWAHGGKTALDNLKPRCKLHHMLKTEGIWPAGRDDDGAPGVTSLGGKTYTTLPEPPPPF